MKKVYQICVSGAAKGDPVMMAYEQAENVAREIARQGHITLTGATTGLPYYAAKAAKQAGGVSIGFSPAHSRLSHVKKYRLPLDGFDTILYTGFGYSGRNLFLVRSSDAYVMVGGRIGTLNELTIALEEKKPIGILLGSGGMTNEVEYVLKAAKRSRTHIYFDTDPKALINKLVKAVNQKYAKLDGVKKKPVDETEEEIAES